MKYCVDTNVIIDFFRSNLSDEKNLLLGAVPIYVNPVVEYELYKGCFLSRDKESSLKIIEDFLSEVEHLPFDKDSSRIAAEIYALMKKRGSLIEESDIMIAAICIAHNATLVTRNKKHFQNIPGLKVEYC